MGNELRWNKRIAYCLRARHCAGIWFQDGKICYALYKEGIKKKIRGEAPTQFPALQWSWVKLDGRQRQYRAWSEAHRWDVDLTCCPLGAVKHVPRWSQGHDCTRVYGKPGRQRTGPRGAALTRLHMSSRDCSCALRAMISRSHNRPLCRFPLPWGMPPHACQKHLFWRVNLG